MASELGGEPLVCTYAAQRLGVYEFLTVHDDTTPTHFAIAAARADLIAGVVAAARAVYGCAGGAIELHEALDALDADPDTGSTP